MLDLRGGHFQVGLIGRRGEAEIKRWGVEEEGWGVDRGVRFGPKRIWALYPLRRFEFHWSQLSQG